MAAAPLGWPALPNASSMSSTRPVMAGDVSLLVAALNHVAGVQLRQVWEAYVEPRADTLQAYDGSGFGPPTPAGVSHTVHVFVQPTSLARHLLIFLVYMAEDEGTTEPMITASLEKVAGGAEDIGITWRRADGSLVCGSSLDQWYVGTPPVANDALAGEASASPATRMLTVTAGARATDCWVKFVVQEARLLAYAIGEFAEETVDP